MTGAQSLFAVAILMDLSLTVYGSVGLLGLFLVQFVSSITMSADVNQTVTIVLSAVYGLLAVLAIARNWRGTLRTSKNGLWTSFATLERAEEKQAAEHT